MQQKQGEDLVDENHAMYRLGFVRHKHFVQDLERSPQPRLTPQAQIVAFSCVSGRPRYITTAHQYSVAARASQPITLTNSTACRPRGAPSGSITWLIHCQFPETNLNDCGKTPRTSSPFRIFVVTMTLNHAAQKSRLMRLIPNNVTRSGIAISWRNHRERYKPNFSRLASLNHLTFAKRRPRHLAPAMLCNVVKRGAKALS